MTQKDSDKTAVVLAAELAEARGENAQLKRLLEALAREGHDGSDVTAKRHEALFHQTPTYEDLVDQVARLTDQLTCVEREELFHVTSDGVFIADRDGRYLDVNPAGCRMVGYTREELLRLNVADLVPPEHLPRQEALKRKMAAGAAEQSEWQLLRKDGTCMTAELTSNALSGGRMQAVVRDITERKGVEEALRSSELQLRAILEQSPLSMALVAMNGTIEYFNRRTVETFGYLREDVPVMDRWWVQAFPDEAYRAEVVAGWVGLVREASSLGREIERREYRITCKNGTVKTTEIFGVIVAGKILVMFDDITKRKRAEEEALRKSEAMLKGITDAINEPIFMKDRECRWLFANPATLKVVGKSLDEVLGKTNVEIYGDASLGEALTKIDRRIMDSGVAETLEGNVQTPRGNRTFLASKSPLCDQDGRVIGLVGTAQDITDRKRIEEALLAGRTMLWAALASMTDAVFISDGYGTFTEFNDAFATFHRFENRAECGKHLADYQAILDVFMPNGDLVPLDMWAVPRALRGEVVTQAEYGLRRKDTGETWVGSYSFGPIRDRHGAIVGSVVTARDITAQRLAELQTAKLEAQLQQAQKMESVGRLAGGVAHDFNNMLAVILGNTEEAMEHVDPSSQLHEDLEEVRKAATRSADLTRQLLAFARRQTVTPKVLDLNDTVSNILAMLRRLLGETVHVAWLPCERLWPVQMDPSQLDQTLTNLCLNARDSMAGGGTVTVETANAQLDEAYCEAHEGAATGDYVRLSVSDTGRGMSAETLSHVFEPFFTTKEVGKGTGLGLATVYGVVKQNKGFLDVSSERGKGTTFAMYLPRHAGDRALVAVNQGPEAAPHGTETVLLVEDEASVLRLAKKVLERFGHTVLTAGNAAEAIALAERHSGEIHLLMTDVVMPEMNGRELARTLLSRYPRLKCLFMSGYTADAIAEHGVVEGGFNFIQKPFSTGDLAAKVRQVLDGKDAD